MYLEKSMGFIITVLITSLSELILEYEYTFVLWSCRLHSPCVKLWFSGCVLPWVTLFYKGEFGSILSSDADTTPRAYRHSPLSTTNHEAQTKILFPKATTTTHKLIKVDQDIWTPGNTETMSTNCS